jgi:hypothetical protein
MSRDDATTEILKPMQKLFDPPRPGMSDEDTVAALDQYADSLEQFDGNVLREAWRQTREHWLRGTWPTIAVIIRHATLIARQLRPAREVAIAIPRSRAEQATHNLVEFCKARGLNPSVMERPNLWWLLPPDKWRADWRITQAPRQYLAVHQVADFDAEQMRQRQQPRQMQGGPDIHEPRQDSADEAPLAF